MQQERRVQQEQLENREKQVRVEQVERAEQRAQQEKREKQVRQAQVEQVQLLRFGL